MLLPPPSPPDAARRMNPRDFFVGGDDVPEEAAEGDDDEVMPMPPGGGGGATEETAAGVALLTMDALTLTVMEVVIGLSRILLCPSPRLTSLLYYSPRQAFVAVVVVCDEAEREKIDGSVVRISALSRHGRLQSRVFAFSAPEGNPMELEFV